MARPGAKQRSTSARRKPQSPSRPAASPSLIVHLQDQLQAIAERCGPFERRKVLASDGWFAGGKLFALVTRKGRVVVKLADPAAQDALLALPGTTPWQIGKRAPMRAWLQLPESMHDEPDALFRWVQAAWRLAGS
jgi:TfoX/Sxy family transcriptional regulator of competence genes